MKKSTILIVIGLILSYFCGIYTDKLVVDNMKGKGDYFYSESLHDPERIIYHSTSRCPKIKNGVTIGQFFKYPSWRFSMSSFCPKCMDDTLMEKCSIWLYSEGDGE